MDKETPVHLRLKPERGQVRIITYAKGKGGHRRTVGSVLVDADKVGDALKDHRNLVVLGIETD